MALWAGRFEKDMDQLVKEFNASIGFDVRAYRENIEGSIAHVTMLAKQGIVTEADRDAIVAGLERIREGLDAGTIRFTVEDEDIAMGVEARLIKDTGDVGKKLHTARSRNDQSLLDTTMLLRREMREIEGALADLMKVILDRAEAEADVLMPGFTHMQHAQPITVGFWFMAYFQMFRRDLDRLQDCRARTDFCPLGACALAGTTLPIDRQAAAEALGFSAPTENAMDTVSDRDFMIEFLSAASISMMHLSRWAEEFVWYNSTEFSYLALDDSFCTGSSIMPQKKNPDIAELLRGKVGRVYGDLMGLLTVLKGTPLAFNKDFQEDKEKVYDAIDTWKASIRILEKMIGAASFRPDVLNAQLEKGFLNATDVAEHLVVKGIPFREAHEIVGHMVRACEKKRCRLEDLTDADLSLIDPRLSKSMVGDIGIRACVNARRSYGGTAPAEVRRQVASGREWLARAMRG